MKKLFKRSATLLLSAVMLLGLVPMGASATANTEITLWTYPIGGWAYQIQTEDFIGNFEAANPGISVNVEYLNYADGDEIVNTAIEGGCAPDLILSEPERIVGAWSTRGSMVDLSDMLDDTDRNEIYPNILNACIGSGNSLYMYPLAGTVHVMAINKTVFTKADAMKYINQDTYTWKSTEDFFKALEAVADYTGNDNVGVVYCGGQGGDQGTRALVTNLYGGSFANSTHTAYTWDSDENIKAFTTLYNCKNLPFDPSVVGGDEIAMFYHGILNVAFCWNVVQQKNPMTAGTGAAMTFNGDEIMFMAFPSDGAPSLQGGIWGFGIFDNGNSEKIAAAKTFVKYMCDSSATVDAVRTSQYFPVRTVAEGTDLSITWESDPIMREYNKLMSYIGDYYAGMPSWSEARTSWWNMLQTITGDSDEIAETVRAFTADVNATMPEQEIPDPPATPDTNTAVYRLYNPYTYEHLLTSGEQEKDALVSIGWHLDGVAWEAPVEGIPVYRLYNPYDDWHTYTISEAERDTMVAAGWTVDGVVSRGYDGPNGRPIYRLFNPYVQTNFHLFTAGVDERDMLVNAGWILEGIAWSAVR